MDGAGVVDVDLPLEWGFASFWLGRLA